MFLVSVRVRLSGWCASKCGVELALAGAYVPEVSVCIFGLHGPKKKSAISLTYPYMNKKKGKSGLISHCRQIQAAERATLMRRRSLAHAVNKMFPRIRCMQSRSEEPSEAVCSSLYYVLHTPLSLFLDTNQL